MYEALLVSPDGDYVIDYEGRTKEEVVHQLQERRSQYIFYPYEFIIKLPFSLNNYVVDHPYEDFTKLKRFKIRRLLDTFKEAAKESDKESFDETTITDF